ncbi:xylulokinase [Saccharicrinis sp. GN24d3]|uniref:xylulokinase n=1 Tax=Saccharicrinis sp. GN24d3 TaxID=3458416 RepID=UPI004035DF17
METNIIAYDLGTSGCKASLYDASGNCMADSFITCETHYPQQGWHEQKPKDWWSAVVQSTKVILAKCNVSVGNISAIGISGHSLGLVPLDKEGKLLASSVPIWSDSRPTEKELEAFFSKIPEEEWYMITGNGFPPALYTVFKLMWLKNNQPELCSKIHTVVGTKDYINYKMTGVASTDYSYASGSGVFDLINWKYSNRLIAASGLPATIFPKPVASTDVLGQLSQEVADELGLHAGVKVVAGGVDNSCMALGARCFKEGRTYNSLGSSAWLAVSSQKPLLNPQCRPYVFAHVVPGMFASATAIFAAGTSFKWLRNNICDEFMKHEGESWKMMTDLAESAPVGSNKLLFNPSLAGGTMMDKSAHIKGAIVGIDQSHKKSDIIRAVMEGVAMGLRVALDELRNLTSIDNEITVVGGGSKSDFWRQLYADIYNAKIIKTNIDQQAAALGAAALAAVGTGIWSDFSIIDKVHQTESVEVPQVQDNKKYEKILPVYKQLSDYLSEVGDVLNGLKL